MAANTISNLMARISVLSGHEINIPSLDECKQTHERATKEAEEQQWNRFAQQQRDYKIEKALGGSFIPDRYQQCSFDNYEVTNDGQMNALKFAKCWISDFLRNNKPSSFTFSGETGTGKNHIAAAMCMQIIKAGGLAKLITVNELDQHRRASCFGDSATTTEVRFMRELATIDLLILDEVGLSTNSQSQRVFVDQLINARVNNFLPTGMLTNLNIPELSADLGPRIMNRMGENGGSWINFHWESFRTRGRNS
ncbi:ATP-binding protein [Vibrio harveyi]|uniref:ATP-binding protein n=1 Tax=Vibrio harveyi TaxID=669 RepID=UPI003BB739B1